MFLTPTVTLIAEDVVIDGVSMHSSGVATGLVLTAGDPAYGEFRATDATPVAVRVPDVASMLKVTFPGVLE
jgi:hypothetical protein